ncbi:Phosphatidylinositol phosphate synthase [subsurface metagenome]
MDSVIPEKRWSMAKLSEVRKVASYYLTQPAVRILARTSITPNAITWFGFLLAVGAAAFIITGYLFAAGLVVLLAGFFDILDGALARHRNQTTRFGAVLDSTLDRLAEAVVLLGILVLFLLTEEQPILLAKEWSILLVGVALLGSLLVSYVKARAEALGLECQVGLFTRAERVIVLALGLLLNQIAYALVIALAIIAVFSFITVGQRLLYVWQQTRIN